MVSDRIKVLVFYQTKKMKTKTARKIKSKECTMHKGTHKYVCTGKQEIDKFLELLMLRRSVFDLPADT